MPEYDSMTDVLIQQAAADLYATTLVGNRGGFRYVTAGNLTFRVGVHVTIPCEVCGKPVLHGEPCDKCEVTLA